MPLTGVCYPTNYTHPLPVLTTVLLFPCLCTDTPTSIPLPPFPTTRMQPPPAPTPYLPPAKHYMSIPTPKTSSARLCHKRTPASIHEEIFLQPPQTLTPTEMDDLITATLDREEKIPTDTPLRQAIGKTMYPNSLAANHPTTPMLKEWAQKGCPVDCGENWDREQIVAALRRGPHISAKHPDDIASLHAETEEKMRNGYARVIRWGDIKNKLLRKLKSAPSPWFPISLDNSASS